MIHGYHATFSTYGSYLPNAPRGSKSKYVGGRRIYETAGKVRKTPTRNINSLQKLNGKPTDTLRVY